VIKDTFVFIYTRTFMKSFKFALVLTTLLAHYGIECASIVTVKTTEVIQYSKAGQKIKKRLEMKQVELAKPFEKIEAQIKAEENALMEKQKALARKDEEFKKQATLLSPDAYADKYDELQKEHRDLEAEITNFQRSMRLAQEDAKKVDQKLEIFYRKEMMAFEQQIKELIEQVAKAEGWDIVIAKEACIYANISTDKTEKIIKELDKHEEKEDKNEDNKNSSAKPHQHTPKKTSMAPGA
jgi:Skp family chaperone for outer membrane proteins